MTRIVKADPEASTFILFEPALVSDDFRAANQNETHDRTLRELSQSGKLVLIETQGDTDGYLHVYLAESLPDTFSQFIRNRNQISQFKVHGSELHFSAIPGYIHPDEFHLPAKGSKFDIPAGCYDMEILELDISRKYMMNLLAKKASKREYFFFKWFDTLMIVAGIVVLCCLASVFFLSWFNWLLVLLCVGLPTFLVTQVWCRSKAYQQALRHWSSLYKKVPSLAVTFNLIKNNNLD